MSKSLKGIKSIRDFQLQDQRVFLRLDLNVPLKGMKITDDHRLVSAIPTIKYALDHGAKVVIASHLGRPKDENDREGNSLEPVATELQKILKVDVILVEEPRSEAPKALLSGLKRNQIIMLENLRFDPDETENGQDLARRISEYTDIYINDAFGACHRAHSSIDALPRIVEKKGIGFLIEKEVKMLEMIKTNPERPYYAILGGAKVSDKIPLIDKLIDIVDGFVIGGAMAYTFLAAQDVPLGKSRVEKDKVSFAKDLMSRMKSRNKKLILPVDHIAVPDIGQVDQLVTTNGPDIRSDLLGVDIGPKTIELIRKNLQGAKTVFWNGPMGIFETPAYSHGTFSLARTLAELEGATVVVGGGDSASAAKAAGIADKLAHVSTGGGVSLEFVQGEPLPGLEALRPPKRSETGEREVLEGYDDDPDTKPRSTDRVFRSNDTRTSKK